MSKHVVVLKGGLSAERDVSLKSGDAVARALREAGYHVSELDVNTDVTENLRALKPDVVFNALHGQYGEDGVIQGMLELLSIPYTHSGVMSSAVAMDKVVAKKLFNIQGIPVAEDVVVKGGTSPDDEPMQRPYVLKPLNEGSSVGVLIVDKETSNKEIEAFYLAHDYSLMAEKYLPGRELTVAVMGDRALAVTELKPKAGFYDYKAKYQEGMTDHIIPANITTEHYDLCLKYALEAHKVLGCKGVSRSDFRLDDGTGGDQIPYILETNTQPGMTDLSLVPEQARYHDISFVELVQWMVEDASCGR